MPIFQQKHCPFGVVLFSVGLAEWLNAEVLKTFDSIESVGSNPTPHATPKP